MQIHHHADDLHERPPAGGQHLTHHAERQCSSVAEDLQRYCLRSAAGGGLPRRRTKQSMAAGAICHLCGVHPVAIVVCPQEMQCTLGRHVAAPRVQVQQYILGCERDMARSPIKKHKDLLAGFTARPDISESCRGFILQLPAIAELMPVPGRSSASRQVVKLVFTHLGINELPALIEEQQRYIRWELGSGEKSSTDHTFKDAASLAGASATAVTS
jgi:hypothetical protein